MRVSQRLDYPREVVAPVGWRIPRPSRWVLLALAMAPLALEAMMLVVGRWSTILGRPWSPETPVWSFLRSRVQLLGRHLELLFEAGQWSSDVVVTGSLAIFVVGVLLIRKG